MKRLVVISGSEATRIELDRQLRDLLGDRVEVDSFALDGSGPRPVRGGPVVLLTSPLIEAEAQPYLDPTCKVLIAKRTLNFAHLDKLYAMPTGSSLLVVNDARETADEVIELLRRIGFDRHRFTAYYPGAALPVRTFDFVITPGEAALIPMRHERVIDIGTRILDIASIIEITQALEIVDARSDEQVHLISAKYMRKIISLGQELHAKHAHVQALNGMVLQVINSVDDGILAYDGSGRVVLINRIAAGLLGGLEEGADLLAETRRRDRGLHAFLKAEGQESHILQREDASWLVGRLPGAGDRPNLLTFKNIRERINMENRLRSELKKQGYRAKYTFGDLVHRSQVMTDLIARGRKLAESESSLLLYGESGTGKELFASAVHNASARRDGPFLAVNFSALPDDLIESELFGYEEGAFTGAKRGGKVGLFELATQGTLFLDEIGDISPKIQSRLLRVLQEKEVMKVGGTKNIPVDVRVVAATNKDLAAMVKAGTFREDLYYRLKKLYLNLPPLRARREDILPLFHHFLVRKRGAGLELGEDARALLCAYDWPGNVRELGEQCGVHPGGVRGRPHRPLGPVRRSAQAAAGRAGPGPGAGRVPARHHPPVQRRQPPDRPGEAGPAVRGHRPSGVGAAGAPAPGRTRRQGPGGDGPGPRGPAPHRRRTGPVGQWLMAGQWVPMGSPRTTIGFGGRSATVTLWARASLRDPRRGKSGLRRAVGQATPGRGDPTESATESRPPMAPQGDQARVKGWGKSPPPDW